MKALISVSDKTGIVELAQQLHALGVGLISASGKPPCWTASAFPSGSQKARWSPCWR